MTNKPTLFSGSFTDLTNKPTTIVGYGITDAYQTLSINGNQLTISGTAGNTVTLPSGSSSSNLEVLTSTQIAALTPETGKNVFNSTESLYQVYDGTKWNAIPATCWPQPTTADAGSDQYFYDGTVSTTLAANTPEVGHGTGMWSIISGTGGSFDDATNPAATFTGQLHESYNLQWSITSSCETSTDDVIIVFGKDEPGASVTDIDGNTYNTVWIGSQLWMAADLKVSHYPNGTAIPYIDDDATWVALADDNTSDAYSFYGDSNNDGVVDIANPDYGALYTWAAAMGDNAVSSSTNPSGVQGVCPAGWHLPSDAEWTTLTTYLGGESVAGGKLKETGTTHWSSPNTGATNESGFSALPGGSRNSINGTFYNGSSSPKITLMPLFI